MTKKSSFFVSISALMAAQVLTLPILQAHAQNRAQSAIEPINPEASPEANLQLLSGQFAQHIEASESQSYAFFDDHQKPVHGGEAIRDLFLSGQEVSILQPQEAGSSVRIGTKIKILEPDSTGAGRARIVFTDSSFQKEYTWRIVKGNFGKKLSPDFVAHLEQTSQMVTAEINDKLEKESRQSSASKTWLKNLVPNIKTFAKDLLVPQAQASEEVYTEHYHDEVYRHAELGRFIGYGIIFGVTVLGIVVVAKAIKSGQIALAALGVIGAAVIVSYLYDQYFIQRPHIMNAPESEESKLEEYRILKEQKAIDDARLAKKAAEIRRDNDPLRDFPELK